MTQYIKNGVIWVKRDKNGKPFFSFNAERDIKKGENFNFFKNDKGGVETRPDYKSFERVEEEGQTKPKNQVEEDDSGEVADQIPF